MKKVLVIGATSGVGATIRNRLLETNKYQVVGTSRHAGQRTSAGNLSWRNYDANHSENLEALFEGIDMAFLMSSPSVIPQDKVLIPLIEAAKAAQVKKVVMMTAIGVDASDEIPFRKAELVLGNSGLAHSIIRPNWFHQNLSTYWLHGIQTQQKLFIPAGQGKTSFIDVRDIADCAINLLTNNKADNQAYTLTGPESLSYDDAAAILSQTTKQTISYVDVDPEDFKQGLIAASLAEDFADFLINILSFVKAGYVAEVNSTVENILGRPPISLQQYVEEEKESWVVV